MSKRTRTIVLLVLLALILGYIIYVLWVKPNRVREQTIAVTTVPVIAKDLTINLHTIGTVQAYNSVAVKSQVTGQLLQVAFHEGDDVKQGQPLFYIDPKPYQALLDQATAALAQDEAQLANAKAVLGRNQVLERKGFVSQQDFDAAHTNVAGLVAKVQADLAMVENAKLQLSYCTITAPIGGRTGDLKIDPGNLIKENDNTPLVMINQITPIYVRFSIPSEYLLELQHRFATHPIEISVKTESHNLQGKLSFIDNTVNADTGTILLKATFANEAVALWPGEFVKVQVPAAELSNALVIPTVAVQMGQHGAYVFVVKDNVAHLQKITTGAVQGELTVITSGLTVGDAVVTSGLLRLQDGAPVQVIAAP